MWDLFIGFAIAVTGALSGHQQQMPRDVHNIQACESHGNESCALKEYPNSVDGRPAVLPAVSGEKEVANVCH